MRSLVVGRPILLALEDIDGSPSFLEKALRHVEAYGRHTGANLIGQGGGLHEGPIGSHEKCERCC